MLRIGQLKLPPNHSTNDLRIKIVKELSISDKDLINYEIRKFSIDARRKNDIKFVYTIDASIRNESHFLKSNRKKNISIVKEKTYEFPKLGNETLIHRPVIIGSGPSGLFAAYLLAMHGFRPMIFERGKAVEDRLNDISIFWETGVLNPQSNVQFGEGGAGTFSDGKLNTLVKDVSGRNGKVLEIFVENGAPKEILYTNKPHIGTDILINIVRNMRNRIIEHGGEFLFENQFIDFEIKDEQLKEITVQSGTERKTYQTNVMILAIGHSARDTFEMLYQKKLPIVAKSFAVGVRVEHKQQMIQESQYGETYASKLPPASYKVTANLENGRGVYSFCMCPGGYVVNASSEPNRLAVNGMSYHARNGINANSAIIVSVTKEDFGQDHPLSGMYFQRTLEEKAYQIGKGNIPVQRFEDFCLNQSSNTFGNIVPQTKGQHAFGNVREIFPNDIATSIEEAMYLFERQIKGFSDKDTILSGVESRTSSPIRIERNETLQIGQTGIYPCGEGAGYAGGITSAAMDGIKVAEMIAQKYAPFDSK